MIILADKNDFSTTVRRAISEIEAEYERLNGLVICGSHSPRDLNGKLNTIKKAREDGTPTLGICMGLHYMVIEHARNVMGLEGANSIEINKRTKYPVVEQMPKRDSGIRMTASGNLEQFWHSYRVNEELLGKGWEVSLTHRCIDTLRLPDHPFYVGVQYHPEYLSSIGSPHPLLVNFLDVCRKHTADMLRHSEH